MPQLGSKLVIAIALLAISTTTTAKPLHRYVFFGMDREKIKDAKSFLETPGFEGAQVAYSWRQLEPRKDNYDFNLIREDLAFLAAHGKKLWIQIQDVTFSDGRIPVPKYLTEDSQYHGGADRQYKFNEGDEEHATTHGWAARRWDAAVQQRFYELLFALGKEFDGRIEGINFAESSVTFGETGRLFPKGYTRDIYREALIANMKVLKRSFPKSIAMQYANFMPGGRSDLELVYKAARELNVAVGGPDLLPFRPFQLANSYPLIRESAGLVPTGIAVQDGNYGDVNRKTGRRADISELVNFATDYLRVDYMFWCTEEPYFSDELVPFVRAPSSIVPAAQATTRPTPTPLYNGYPSVSPDGSHIAFTSNRGGADDLFVISADGNGERQLTHTAEAEVGLQWTSDSKAVVFSVLANDTSRLYSVDLDGKRRDLGSVAGRTPMLSPDGKRLVYMAGTWTATRLIVSALDGSNTRQINDGAPIAWNNHWSPDGKRIAFTGKNESGEGLAVFIMNADGSERRQVTHIPAAEGSAQWPVWSADSLQLAIQVSNLKAHSAHIWIVDIRSGEARKIAAHDQSYLDETPSWFPNGKRIAFQSNRTGKMEVWVMNADGSGQRQVTARNQR